MAKKKKDDGLGDALSRIADWTTPFSPEAAQKNDQYMCHVYFGCAMEESARRPRPGLLKRLRAARPDHIFSHAGAAYDPTAYLALLEELGFDGSLIRAKALEDFQRVVQRQEDAKAKAEAFFKRFREEWHVSEADVKEYLDDHSIYYLLDLAVANARSTKARLGAVRRHTENRMLKAEVFKWMDENWKPGLALDDAALAIAQKVVPLKLRAVRDHLTEWKKLRSASRP